MDQKKIGNFISEARKSKNLTQKDLAEKLNVSINAVSKWERGICLMDMSLLKPLSQILDISITEIINGEKDNNNIENAIENTINYSNNKLKLEKRKKHIILFVSILIICFIGLLSYKGLLIYCIDMTTQNINEYIDDSRKDYGAPIYINTYDIDNYYSFKNLKIKDIFKEAEFVNETIDSIAYIVDENKNVAISTNIPSNLSDIYKYEDDIINRDKYFKKLDINTDLELLKFVSNFSTKYYSIFNTLSYLKKYYFEISLYNLSYYSFDEVHEIKGDLNGYVVILENHFINYHIIHNNIEYQISFIGNFDYNYTKDIISTIKIN